MLRTLRRFHGLIRSQSSAKMYFCDKAVRSRKIVPQLEGFTQETDIIVPPGMIKLSQIQVMKDLSNKDALGQDLVMFPWDRKDYEQHFNSCCFLETFHSTPEKTVAARTTGTVISRNLVISCAHENSKHSKIVSSGEMSLLPVTQGGTSERLFTEMKISDCLKDNTDMSRFGEICMIGRTENKIVKTPLHERVDASNILTECIMAFGYSKNGASVLEASVGDVATSETLLTKMNNKFNGSIGKFSTSNCVRGFNDDKENGNFIDNLLSSTHGVSGSSVSLKPGYIEAIHSSWFASSYAGIISRSKMIMNELRKRGIVK